MPIEKQPVLDIRDVTIAYQIEEAHLDTVRNVSLQIGARQIYGLVGESGSGKSTLALAVMGYLAANGRVTGGQILLDGENLLEKSTAEMRSIWGRRMNLVPQDPGGALNPAIRVGEQIAEIARHHYGLSRKDAWARSIELLRDVRIADPQRVAQRYPHQLSGGMQQRVMIAMALSTEPRVLVLDEPTTALDVTTEATVLDLFNDLIQRHETATLYVTHNLGVVAQICHRVAVMYAGEIVEDADVRTLFCEPLHPYTIGLLRSVPRLRTDGGSDLMTIDGGLPSRSELPTGCIFAARCPFVQDRCRTIRPPYVEALPGHRVSCHRWEEIATGTLRLDALEHESPPQAERPVEPLLHAEVLSKRYPIGTPLLAQIRATITHIPPPAVRAVDEVSLDIHRGETIGLVGESGSGKTTFARCLVGLVDRSSGTVSLLSYFNLAPAVTDRPAEALQHIQMVFQNPDESLNPYQTVGEALRRPLMTLLHYRQDQADERIAALLRSVHLPEEYANRQPDELSGGEKQRVAIARAFATSPDLIVLDEAVSALDVSVQAAILKLLHELKRDTSYLFISHDLAVVAYLADTIAVMYLGQLVETLRTSELLQVPVHPYTEALLSAIPTPDPDAPRDRIRLDGEIPSPSDLPTGCRFHTRCPRKWGPICEQEEPPWVPATDGHLIRCHHPLDHLAIVQAETRKGAE
ncbi:MAG TPA: dipeptide ABC transporter ATP-binding protein [Aggregatilineales bacterium]|nr:dipeptide ABC transporter ATP-binding protein [Aggregatilineales bacterium]